MSTTEPSRNTQPFPEGQPHRGIQEYKAVGVYHHCRDSLREAGVDHERMSRDLRFISLTPINSEGDKIASRFSPPSTFHRFAKRQCTVANGRASFSRLRSSEFHKTPWSLRADYRPDRLDRLPLGYKTDDHRCLSSAEDKTFWVIVKQRQIGMLWTIQLLIAPKNGGLSVDSSPGKSNFPGDLEAIRPHELSALNHHRIESSTGFRATKTRKTLHGSAPKTLAKHGSRSTSASPRLTVVFPSVWTAVLPTSTRDERRESLSRDALVSVWWMSPKPRHRRRRATPSRVL